MIIKNGLILTMDKQNRTLKNYSILVKGNIIKKIIRTNKLKEKNEKVIDAKGKIVLPGFVSVHTHSVHSLLRGEKEEGKNLYQWMDKVLFPGLRKYKRKDAFNAARLWHKEALRAGITTFVDSSDFGSMKKIYEPTLQAHKKSEMRVLYGAYFFDKNKTSLKIPVDLTKKALNRIKNLMEKFNKKNSLIKVCPSPAETNFVSKEGLLGCLELAKKFNMPVTLHCSETKKDSKVNGISAIEYLNKIGFLNERVLLAHCVWVNEKEINFLKKNNVKIAHNPTTNAFLADGIMPLQKLLKKNICVGIGMDDPNNNSNVNFLANLKFMCLIQKSSTLNAKIITARKALRMATIEGAKCIGMEKEIGSIEEGKKADMILVEINNYNQIPLRNPFFNLVYQCYGNEISYSIINGKLVWKK